VRDKVPANEANTSEDKDCRLWCHGR
jgi:hypothetical protein